MGNFVSNIVFHSEQQEPCLHHSWCLIVRPWGEWWECIHCFEMHDC